MPFKLIFETIDEKQTIAITFMTEENMRCIVDIINHLHFKNYFKYSVENDEKLIKSIRENGGK